MSGFGSIQFLERSVGQRRCAYSFFHLLLWAQCFFCGVRGTVLVTNTIAAAAAAAGTTMFALKFHQDTELSAQMVSITTLGAIVSMPLVVGVAQFLA